MIARIRRWLAIRSAQRKLDSARRDYTAIRWGCGNAKDRAAALQAVIDAHRVLTNLRVRDLWKRVL